MVVFQLDLALSRASSFSAQVLLDDEVRVRIGRSLFTLFGNDCIIISCLMFIGRFLQAAMNEIPEIIVQCVSRDEAALAIAQKVGCGH